MAESIAHRGPDGKGEWRERNIALGCQLFRYTPESFDDQCPGKDEHGHRVVFDGRLDNREELKERLDVRSNRDTDILLAAYRRYGDGFAAEVEGEFAIVLFDPKHQRLLLARDVVGTRPLYYCRIGSLVAFGSEIKAVLQALPESPRPNVHYLGINLLGGIPPADGGPTCFEQVITVIPGNTSIFAPGDSKREFTHWDYEVEKPLVFKRDAEYAEALAEIFARSVKRRARSRYPVAISLSGGIDSSSVFCTAERLRRSEPGLFPQLVGLNQAGPRGSSADEWEYIEAIQRDYQATVKHFEYEFRPILAGLPRSVRAIEAPVGDLHWRNNDILLEGGRSAGARSILSGHWGDQVLFDCSYLADLLRTMRWRTLTKHLRDLPGWMDGAPRSWLVRLAVRHSLKSFVPSAARSMIIAYRRRTAPMHRDQPWFTPWFRDEARKKWPIYRPLPKRFVSQTAKLRYLEAHAKLYQQSMEIFSKIGTAAGVDYLFPFLDRDLLQFMMRIPGEKTAPGGVHRGLMREAMRGTLPEEIRTRRTKANVTFAARNVLQRQYTEIVDFFANNHTLAEQGYIDAQELQSTLAKIQKTMPQYGGNLIWDISDLLAFDEWLRQFILDQAGRKSIAAAPGNHEQN
jgi:asparagine synthase (glutamine-hydrolysing)